MVKEECPGVGQYARDLAGNARAACPVCGRGIRLTKSGCVRFHKRIKPKTQRVQRQDSVTDQLHDLIRLANDHGLYDAADWVRKQAGYA